MRQHLSKALGRLAEWMAPSPFRGQHPAFYAALKRRGTITSRDRAVIAAHEAGHALCYALLQPLPDYVRATLQRGPVLDDDLGFVTSIIYPHELEDITFLRWEMLMLLAGQQAESIMLNTSTTGPAQDLARWEAAARHYFSIQPSDVLFYAQPTTDLELASNNRLLSQELTKQRATVRAFLQLNLNQLRRIAWSLEDHDLDATALRDLFGPVTVTRGLPHPDLT